MKQHAHNPCRTLTVCAVVILWLSLIGAGVNPILLVDPSVEPTVRVRWTTSGGETRELEGTRPFASDGERTLLGRNIEAFVAIGGTRLSKGAGHPRGAVARVGFYKHESGKPWFDGITRESEITIEITGLRFNQAVDVNPLSGVQHLKYAEEDLESCGLPGDAREQFNTASVDDTLNGRVRPGIDARLGILDGSDDALGNIEVFEEPDGTVSARAVFRYPALRNLRDPWQSDLPGTFLEPIHFHIEFEVLPEGVQPLVPSPAVPQPD